MGTHLGLAGRGPTHHLLKEIEIILPVSKSLMFLVPLKKTLEKYSFRCYNLDS